MSLRYRGPAAVAGAAIVLGLLAACASTAAQGGSPGNPVRSRSASAAPASPSPARSGSASTAPASASPAPFAQGQSPQARAAADAAAIAAQFVPPPGATRLPGAPADVGGQLSPTTAVREDVAYARSWWQVPGMTPLQFLAWEKAHLPGQFQLTGREGEEITPPPGQTLPADPYQLAGYFFSVPAVPGVSTAGELDLTSARGTSGRTYASVQAQVAWQPPRPPSTDLPAAGIHAVVVTAVPGLNDTSKPPGPLTVTDRAMVSKLVALINGLPLFILGAPSCPFDDGRGVRLTFLGAAGGPTVATAFAKANGCGGVQLTMGRQQTMLGGGSDAAQQAITISGLHWKL